jgi:hypothetical protein
MNHLRLMSRILVSIVLIIAIFESIYKNGQTATRIYNAFDEFYAALTFIGLLILGGFYGQIEE